MMWIGVVLALAAAPADSGVRVVTLSEALAMAQKNAPQAIQALGQVRTSAADVRSAYASFIPSVSLSAGATRQYTSGARTQVQNGQVVTLPSEPWSYSGSVGASVELFDGGRRFFDLRAAHADAGAARANEVSQHYAVALAVKQQYYNVLAARESEAAARSQLEQAEQQFRVAVLKVREKTATRSDSLRSEIQLRNAQLAVLTARNSLQVAVTSLTRTLGADQPVTAAADVPDGPALDLDETNLKRLADDSPMVREAEAALDAARASRRASWTNYLPSLSGSYSRGANGTDPNFGLGADTYTYSGALRLSLSFPLFNQLQRESQLVRAQVAEDNAVAQLRDARLAAVQGLAQSLGSYRLADQRVAAQTASVASAEEDLRVQQQRYAVGGSTLLDVLASQSQLNQARQDLISARYDRRIALAEIEALVGRDL